jgi:hypothetical protein
MRKIVFFVQGNEFLEQFKLVMLYKLSEKIEESPVFLTNVFLVLLDKQIGNLARVQMQQLLQNILH